MHQIQIALVGDGALDVPKKMKHLHKIMWEIYNIQTNMQYKFCLYSRGVEDVAPYKRT